MPATYYAIITALGLQRLAEATGGSDPVVFTEIAVGDGSGSPVTPDPDQTALVNEVWRDAVNTVDLHAEAPTTFRIEGLIPADEGGWTIREVGVFNGDGELLAVASYPPVLKPAPEDSVVSQEYIRLLLVYADANKIALTVDGSVVVATREWVDTNRRVETEHGFLNASGVIPIVAGVFFYNVTSFADDAVLATLPIPPQNGMRIRIRAKVTGGGSININADGNSNEFSSLDVTGEVAWADLWGLDDKWIYEAGTMVANA